MQRVFLAFIVLDCALVLLCLLAGLAEGLGAWVWLVAAVLVATVVWLAWRQRRSVRAHERLAGEVHDVYMDAADRADGGDLAAAGALYERAMDESVRVHGPADPFTMVIVADLASVRLSQGNLAAATELRERAHQACRTHLGEDSVDTLSAQISSASALLAQGDLRSARERYEQALDRCQRTLDNVHPETRAAECGLARTLAAQGDLSGAERLYRRAAEHYAQVLGPLHPDTVAVSRAQALIAAGNPDDRAAGGTRRIARGHGRPRRCAPALRAGPGRRPATRRGTRSAHGGFLERAGRRASRAAGPHGRLPRLRTGQRRVPGDPRFPTRRGDRGRPWTRDGDAPSGRCHQCRRGALRSSRCLPPALRGGQPRDRRRSRPARLGARTVALTCGAVRGTGEGSGMLVG